MRSGMRSIFAAFAAFFALSGVGAYQHTAEHADGGGDVNAVEYSMLDRSRGLHTCFSTDMWTRTYYCLRQSPFSLREVFHRSSS